MKILQIHNFYGSSSPSGENNVVINEKEALLKQGHDVQTYYVYSDKIRNNFLRIILAAFFVPINFKQWWKIRNFAKKIRPDVIHVHNTFPLLSPFILFRLNKIAPVVMTLHNYRIFCSAGVPLMKGRSCTKCLAQDSIVPALKNSCYRNSWFATIPVAMMIFISKYFNIWNLYVDMFIVLTPFQKKLISRWGVDESKIQLKANFFEEINSKPYTERDNDCIFVGRLSEEKGIRDLIKAWELLGDAAPKLIILGSGELEREIRHKTNNLNIIVKGAVCQKTVAKEVGRAKLLIFPSTWFEGFPLVIGEAFAARTPVIMSDIGSLTDIARNGDLLPVFPPNRPDLLADTILKLFSKPHILNRLSMDVYNEFKTHYEIRSNIDILINIYKTTGVES